MMETVLFCDLYDLLLSFQFTVEMFHYPSSL